MAKVKPTYRPGQPESPEEELARRQKSERGRPWARKPKKLGDVLPTLMARRGYARVQTGDDLQAAWSQAAGETLARFSKAGRVQRGTLEVIVANSTILQELNFAQIQILAKLQKLAPDAGVKKVRFKTGKLT